MNYLLSQHMLGMTGTPVTPTLYMHRLWDMVDEFIYQFQSFAQYRGKLAQKSPHELELLKKCDGVWDLQGVLHYLQGLIDKSKILEALSTDGELVFCAVPS